MDCVFDDKSNSIIKRPLVSCVVLFFAFLNFLCHRDDDIGSRFEKNATV